jgi:hypothetical protein
MLSGSWDDVLPVNGAFELYGKLVNQTISNSYTQRMTVGGHVKELVIYKAMLHNYEVYSPKLIRKALNWASESFGLGTTNYFAPRAAARISMWFIALVSFFASVIFGVKWYDKAKENEEFEEPPLSTQITDIEIEDSKKYLTRKLLLLFASLPIAVILVSVFMAIPVGLPIFNVVYVGIFGGLGFLLLLLYRIGKMPATSGKWLPRISFAKEDYNVKRLGTALLVILSVFAFVIIFTRSGFFYVYPRNYRLLWLGLFTLFSIPGFYIGQIEAEVARNNEKIPRRFFAFNTLIILLPFFIQTLFFIILGSTSGFLGGIHGLIILMITILAGDVVQRIGKSALLTAIFQSLLLQLLVLPQGSLFLIFY